MPDPRSSSGLPSAKGSPFVSGNFNKFFFGIIIAAILIVAIAFAVLRGVFRHTAPAPSQPKSQLIFGATRPKTA